MDAMRTSLAGLLAVATAALVSAGCGGAAASPTIADAASLAPKDAGALVVVNTDSASAQWKNAQALLAKIPGGSTALDSMLEQLGGAKGLDVQKDVAPALGRQLVVVVPNGAKDPVLLVQPDDPKKLDALLAKGTKPHVTGDVDGWTAVATSQKELDAYQAALAKGALSGDQAYTKAIGNLPTDLALIHGYLNGAGLPEALGSVAKLGSSLTGGITVPAAGGAVGQLGTIAFGLSFESGALRLGGVMTGKSAAAPASFTPTLLDGVPADALVAATFDGSGQGQTAIDQALKQGGPSLAGIEKQLGVKLDDLVAALDGEGVLYIRAGSPIPEITLAVEAKDARRAHGTFATLAAKLGSGSGSVLPGFQLRATEANGIVFLSTAPGAAATFTGHGPKLTASARFEAAAKQIGYTGRTSGLCYVDVGALGPLLKTALGALGGSGSGTTTSGLEALSAFGAAAFNTTRDGSVTRFAAVVTVG
jgi:hypothetical protein